MRILIAVTHLLGAGHLTRAAALAGAFARAGHAAWLVSGGSPAPLVRLDGARLVQVPPLRIAGLDFTRLLGPDGRPADGALFERRRQGLLDALDQAEPDAVVTELFPFGRRALAAEFDALVAAARERPERPVVVASVRDILVAPDRPDKVAQAHERVARSYDAVLVHGDPALVPLDASWPLDPGLRGKVRYTGYVDEGGPAARAAPRAGVLVAAGSSAAGLGLFRAAAGAARHRPDLGWRILVGHGVPEPELEAIADGLPDGTVSRARPDYRALLAGAATSVSQCGYNTAVDLLATGTPAVLVPFEAGRETEQRLRADRLAARGLARVLPEADLSAGSLLAAVDEVLASPAGRAPPAAAPVAIDLGGAARSVAIVEELLDLLRSHRAPNGRPGRERSDPAALSRLQAALDRAGGRGTRVALWWRDDDAVAHTPALDRLLDLAGGTPLLISAIPARTEASLARRLSAAAGVSLAVHGLAHANHAPPGAKAAEFGPHRPSAALRADAAAALRLAQERLPPDRLLPVFVPPWNRIAPDLADALPALGYGGLSAAGGAPVPGLVRAEATLDPIAWRGSRSLRDPSTLVADLVAHVEADADRPLGLLTHHLAHDGAVWDFLAGLIPLLTSHPAVAFRDPRRIFARPVDAPAGPPSSEYPDHDAGRRPPVSRDDHATTASARTG